MAERIIEKLKEISNYPQYSPHVCVTAGQLSRIRDEIKLLEYNDFLSILTYVRNFNLPHDFKEELEVEYAIRGQLTKG